MARQRKKESKKQLNKKKLKNKVVTRSKRVEKNYTVDEVREAVKYIREGKSFREAADSTGVPKSTLFRITKGATQIDCKKGAPPVLSTQEEEDIVKWILYCAERGFPVHKKQLLDTVKNYVVDAGRKNPFTGDRPGKKWYSLFMKRHSNLSIRTAQNLTTTRASVSESDLRKWFGKLKEYLQENNLLSLNPKRIFNLDESSFMLVPPKNDGVIAQKGARAIYKIVSGNEKGNLTVLFTAAASGKLLPPMILFDLKTTPRKEILEKIPSDWAVGNTEKGWMTSDSFYKYIVNVFYKWLVDNKYEFPVILYADNHSSHLTMPLAKFCKEKQIELIGLYPNSTHIIQPLDVGLFHVLKEKYKVANDTWRIQNNIVDVKKYMFAGILKQALDSYDFTKCIVNGFRGCGLVPFDPNAVQYNILNKKKKTKQNLTANDTKEVCSGSSADGNETFLQKFERDILSPSILEDFVQNEFNEFWTGDVKLEGLFECWKKMRNTSDIVVTASKVNEDLINNIHVNKVETTLTKSHLIIDNVNIADSDIVFAQDLLGNVVDVSEQLENVLNPTIKTPVIIAARAKAICLQQNSMIHQDVNICVEESTTQINTPAGANQSFSIHTDDNATNDSAMLTPEDRFTSTSQQTATSDELLIAEEITGASDILFASQHILNSQDQDLLNSEIPSPQDSLSNSDLRASTPNDYEARILLDNTAITFQQDFIRNTLHDVGTCMKESIDEPNQQIIQGQCFDSHDHSSSDSIAPTPKASSLRTSKIDAAINLIPSENPISINQSTDTNTATTNVTNNQSLNISQELLKIVRVPQFKSKKKKVQITSQVTVNTVDKVLENLQKKENDKMLRQAQIKLNKKMREEKKALKDKEQIVVKSFQEKKKDLINRKRDFNLQIKNLKKHMKDEINKENLCLLEKQLTASIKQYEEIERELVNVEVQSLQSKIKIKQEKL